MENHLNISHYAKNGIMEREDDIQHKMLYRRIRSISNKMRFRILEITQNKQLSVAELSSALSLTYTKCSDYVKMLEDLNLITKTKDGKNVLVKSSVKFSKNQMKIIG